MSVRRAARIARGAPRNGALIPLRILGALLSAACSSSEPTATLADAAPGNAVATVAIEPRSASDRVAELRERFVMLQPGGSYRARLPGSTHTSRPVIADAAVDRFERADGDRLEPVVALASKRSVLRPASVLLPARADRQVELVDDASHLAVRFALEGAVATPVQTAGGIAIYRAAIHGADVVHRAHAEGTEDFVIFETKPAREELVYRLDVSRAAGLRLVGNVLEFLDAGGAPRLRAAAPYVIDARGARAVATWSIAGCAIDRDPRPALARKAIPPGAATCSATVSWDSASSLRYPLIVDPGWSSTGSMSTPRSGHVAVALAGGRVLVAGGASNSSAEVFDSATGTWSMTGSLSRLRVNSTASVLASGRVLVAGGYDVGTGAFVSTAELYDPTTGLWTLTGALATARASHTASVLNSGKVLVVGGANATNDALSSVELYDPASGAWSATGSMAATRRFHAAALLASSGTVLVVGGDNLATYFSSAELYDPSSGTWSAVGSMAAARSDHSLTQLANGKVIAVGDDQNGAGSTAEVYDPSARTWSTTGAPAKARARHSATLLATGSVLVASDGTSEAYDAVGGKWVATSAMVASRNSHTATLLPDGKVLVAGGTGTSADLSSVEFFAATPTGAPCGTSVECISGFCVDGVCCSTACTGTCVACSAAAKASGATSGTCGPAKSATDPHGTCGDDGSPACANNGLCDGAGACTKYPVATGCTPMACSRGADCTSGFCVDGICCDKACGGACEACTALKKGSGVDGVCGNVAASTDPRDRCPADAGFPTTCRADGFCDGAGACRTFAPAATICGTPTCAASVQKTPTCDGAGVCNLANTSCAPFACAAAGTVCAKTCAIDVDCGAGAYCDTGTCKPKKINGDAASTTSQCQSAIVADGVCCNDACIGLCEACDAGSTKGTCTAVVGSARHGTCPAPTTGNVCSGGVCDGKNRTSCAGLPGSSTPCGAAACTSGTEISPELCDGSGTCPTPTLHKCDPYVCGAKACLSACASAADCVAGSRCDATSGKCVANGSCSTDLTTATAPTGEITKCYPVLCVPSRGACGDTCQSAADCASPFVCDTLHSCVNPPSLATGPGGCASSGRGQRGWLAVGVAFAVLLVRRRRRRTSAERPPRHRGLTRHDRGGLPGTGQHRKHRR
jgi:WD40 repeat protein